MNNKKVFRRVPFWKRLLCIFAVIGIFGLLFSLAFRDNSTPSESSEFIDPPIEGHYLESDATYTFTAYDADSPTRLSYEGLTIETTLDVLFPVSVPDGSGDERTGLKLTKPSEEDDTYGLTVYALGTDSAPPDFIHYGALTGTWSASGFTTGTITDEIIAALPEGFEAWLEANTTKS